MKQKKSFMYFLNKRVGTEWQHVYEHFECDADAMIWARSQIDASTSMVALYRHFDEDTCGAKRFVVSYYA